MKPSITSRQQRAIANQRTAENAAKKALEAIRRRREQEETERWAERAQFDLALLADRLVQRIEEIRDTNAPDGDGEWNDTFCEAVKVLPEARRFAVECMQDGIAAEK